MDELFYEIFENMPRLGPGSEIATIRALISLDLPQKPLKVLDIGCGTGAQTFVLAKNLEGTIIALDNYQPYLDLIETQASNEILQAKIKCQRMDMKEITCKHESLDLVWAEGSIYILGFEEGMKSVAPLLKSGGYAVFSDMNYLKPGAPAVLKDFLKNECPDMMSKEDNIKMIEDNPKFSLVDHFELGKAGHWDPYYAPLQERVFEYSNKYVNNKAALEIRDSIQLEIDLFKEYSDYYGYVFYLMKKN